MKHGDFNYTKGEKQMRYTHLAPCECKLIRLCLGWTQEQLAEAAQCPQSIVSSFENYEIIGCDMLLALEDALIKTGKVAIYPYRFEFKEGNEAWISVNCTKL